ncbi:lysostaphin resistance A-like protein [Elusimicrobiota bacterium]
MKRILNLIILDELPKDKRRFDFGPVFLLIFIYSIGFYAALALLSIGPLSGMFIDFFHARFLGGLDTSRYLEAAGKYFYGALAQNLSQDLINFSLVICGIHVYRLSREEIGVKFHNAGVLVAYTLNAIWITFLLDNVHCWLMRFHYGLYSTKSNIVAYSVAHELGWTYTLFDIGIVGPIIEELFFRGVAYNVLRRNVKESWAVFLSCFAFAFVHLDIYAFPLYFTSGLILTIAYSKTRNIFIPIFVHGFTNIIYKVAVIYYFPL